MVTMATPTINLDDVGRFYRLITKPGDVRETRSPKTAKGTQTAICDNEQAFKACVAALNGQANVYTTASPIKTDLLARAANRVKAYCTTTTADSEIVRRTLQYIDVDAGQPADISATDAERAAALALTDRVHAYLLSMGHPADSFIKVSTGNGGALYQSIDMENTPAAAELLSRYLQALDFQFSEGPGKPHIDVKVYNAARIVKVPGTLAMKGDNTTDRPHRLSHIIEAPDALTPTPTALIEAVANTLPKPPEPDKKKYQGNGNGQINPAEWLPKYSIAIRREKDNALAHVWELKECPWNPEHNHGEAYVMQFKNGAVDAGCHHQSCAGKAWHDLRRIYEPDFDKPKEKKERRGKPSPETYKGEYELNDYGNARRLVAMYGKDIRHCWERNKWLVFVGTHWQWDSGALIQRMAQDTVRAMIREAADLKGKEQSELLFHAYLSQSNGRINAMIAQARSLLGIPITVDETDRNHWLINLSNGTLNLTSGILQPHQREDLITMCLSFAYNPDAKCPEWEKFITEIQTPEVIAYLQRLFGYCLTGVTKAQQWFFFYGIGANGKSTFTNTIVRLMGPYARQMSKDALVASDHVSTHDEATANLQGKRLVVSSEVEENQKLAIGRVKDMTGGERITASRKHEHEVEFDVTFKIIMFGNHKPVITDTTESTWRRVKMTPWNVVIPTENRDDGLPEKLDKEWAGIFAWGVRGTAEYLRIGLSEPETVRNATDQYKRDSDDLGDFLSDFIKGDHAAARIPKTKLHSLYESYCYRNNVTKLKQGEFKSRMIAHGFGEDRGAKGVRVWTGLRESTPMDRGEMGDKVTSGDTDSAKLPANKKIESLGGNTSPVVTFESTGDKTHPTENGESSLDDIIDSTDEIGI